MVGHVEWVQFAHVQHVPSAGEVVHAVDPFEEPAGGGAVAAVQLARLAGTALFITALGEDGYGHRSVARLGELGVDVRAAFDDAPSRRAVTLVDATGERTITTFGPRLDPRGADGREHWSDLEGVDSLYFTAGDVAALRLARASARILVASPRARGALGQGVPLDALVLSGDDEVELGELGDAQNRSALGGVDGRRARRPLSRGIGSERQVGRGSAAGCSGRLLRLWRLVRGWAHFCAGRRHGRARRAGAGGALRRRVLDGAWAVWASAGRGGPVGVAPRI